MEFTTKSAQETKALGKKIAVSIRDRRKETSDKKNHATVLALTGELGSGKTTFVQGLAKGLGIKKRVISPTFILVRKYKISPNTDYRTPITDFYHIDLYRFEKNVEREVRNLGIEEIWNNPENIVAIEWAEKIKRIIPKSATWVEFKNLDGDKRKIIFKNNN